MANIVFIAEPLCNPLPDGIKTYTGGLINSILNLDTKNNYSLIVSKLLKNLDVEQIVVPFMKGPFANERRNLYQLPRILKKLNSDIIHEFTHFGPFLQPGGFKRVVNIYDLIPLLFPETRPHRHITYLRHKWGLPLLLKNIDRIIAISNNTKSDLIKNYNILPDRISVIYGAAGDIFRRLDRESVKLFRRENKIDYPFILNVGTLEPRKNLGFLIDVFRTIKIKYNIPHKLIIAGNRDKSHGALFSMLEKKRGNLEVIIKESIPDTDLVGYYNSADLFVYPSVYEGFGLPVLEALQCGCPVIASDIPSIKEIVQDSIMLLKTDSISNWADRIYKILTNLNIHNDLVHTGLDRAKMFNWQKSAESLISVYEELLNS